MQDKKIMLLFETEYFAIYEMYRLKKFVYQFVLTEIEMGSNFR